MTIQGVTIQAVILCSTSYNAYFIEDTTAARHRKKSDYDVFHEFLSIVVCDLLS